jgi:hypothetical protein
MASNNNNLTSDVVDGGTKWQPLKKRRQNGQFYTFKKGKVEGVEFAEITRLRSQSTDTFKKGRFYQIQPSERAISKKNVTQTKLWYYDKRDYANRRPHTAPEDTKTEHVQPEIIDKGKLYAIQRKTPTPRDDKQLLEENLVARTKVANNVILPVVFKPINTLQSINKSMKYYRY